MNTSGTSSNTNLKQNTTPNEITTSLTPKAYLPQFQIPDTTQKTIVHVTEQEKAVCKDKTISKTRLRTQMSKLSNEEFKITVIHMLRALREKEDIVQE